MKTIYHALNDPLWNNAIIDFEEDRIRALPDETTLPYHYVHVQFEGTGVKFTLCLPEKERYGGHFLQYLSPFPGPDEENASMEQKGEDDKISFALLNGFYEVESNMGSSSAFGERKDNTIVWKSSAACAEYGRRIAMQYYGTDRRPYGYVYGGSGGGYKTMACIENTDAWDGAAPFVIGSPASLPNTICMHAQGERLLRGAFARIVDALDAGGSGNPYQDLTPEQAEGLTELTRMGFPQKTWFLEAHGQMSAGSLPVLLPGIRAKDPSYFKDFWTKPGYEGYENILSTHRDRILYTAKVVRVHVANSTENAEDLHEHENGVDDAWKKLLGNDDGNWIELDSVPEGDDLYLDGTQISFLSGAAAGAPELHCERIEGRCIVIGPSFGISTENIRGTLEKLRPGDEVKLDNSDYIAVQSYYRHQVPADRSFHAWDQFRNPDGTAKIPQRDDVIGYRFTGTGTVQDGDIQGKVIVTQALYDESTTPWCGDWYRNAVEKSGHGDDFRIYYFDRALHGDTSSMETTYITNYLGQLRQVLLDLSAWVEKGIIPLESTQYEYRDGQILVAPTADARHGMQPVIRMEAFPADGTDAETNENHAAAGNEGTTILNETAGNGYGDSPRDCITVRPGQQIRFLVTAKMPDNAGEITHIQYDFSEENKDTDFGEEHFLTKGTFIKTDTGTVRGEILHAYQTPGTHFAAVRVSGQRNADPQDLFTQVKNIARMRIIVRN